ncbi:hypothetical protein niasHT_023937 [Heterodera trifolii]|uniref:Peptidase C1A papain C-terminal domain-containing protein n=1 Tax=Heterodera trifolii TaxID=157864 RepID=A0ABD2JVK1_9BILA
MSIGWGRLSAAAVLTDRICIERLKKGIRSYTNHASSFASAQDTMESQNCACWFFDIPSRASNVWKWFAETGVVTGTNYTMGLGCKPYIYPPRGVPGKELPVKGKEKQCRKQCDTQVPFNYRKGRVFKLKGAPTRWVGTDENRMEEMMREIMTNGPIQVAVDWYKDFEFYGKSSKRVNVYTHKKDDEHPFIHDVKLIGWGEETTGNGELIKFWLGVNSWGNSWGLNGLFKLRRGTDECRIESYDINFGIPDFDDDNVLLAFVSEQSNFEQFLVDEELNDLEIKYSPPQTMKEYLMLKYESQLGIVYLMRRHWHCAKIGSEFAENEQRECQKFRNYLDILYEYLFTGFIELPAVKPQFYFAEIFTFSTLSNVMLSLSLLFKFFFDLKFSKMKGHKLDRYFLEFYELKLANVDKLNYKVELDNYNTNETFEDIIVQMALEARNENEISENEGPLLAKQIPIIWPMFQCQNDQVPHIFIMDELFDYSRIFFDSEYRKSDNYSSYMESNELPWLTLLNESKLGNYTANFGNSTETLRKKFDQKLKSILKKLRDDEKADKLENYNPFMNMPFYDIISRTEDKAFNAFVKGLSNFEHFCLQYADELANICNGMAAEANAEQRKIHLQEKYAAYLGVLSLMMDNWHCAKIGNEFAENERRECQKYRNYLDIFYEYLLHVLREGAFNEGGEAAIKGKSQSNKKEQFDKKLKGMLKVAQQIATRERGKLKVMEDKMEEHSAEENSEAEKELISAKSAAFDDKFGTLFDSPFCGTTIHN